MIWTFNRKREAIWDVRNGGVPLNDVLEAHGISAEEYAEWERAFDAHGIEALKATKLQHFRTAPRRAKVIRAP